MRRHGQTGLLLAVVSCGSATRTAVENRGGSAGSAQVEPMLGERGFRNHIDGSMPTKPEIEAWLPRAIAHVSEASIVVELPGAPQSKLVGSSVPAGIAFLVLENGREIDVFAPEITMSHGLEVGMTLERAKTREPKLTCVAGIGETVCRLPGSRFSFHVLEGPAEAARIDYVTWVLELTSRSGVPP